MWVSAVCADLIHGNFSSAQKNLSSDQTGLKDPELEILFHAKIWEPIAAAAATLVPKKSGFISPLTSASSLLLNNESVNSDLIWVSLISGAARCQLGLCNVWEAWALSLRQNDQQLCTTLFNWFLGVYSQGKWKKKVPDSGHSLCCVADAFRPTHTSSKLFFRMFLCRYRFSLPVWLWNVEM